MKLVRVCEFTPLKAQLLLGSIPAALLVGVCVHAMMYGPSEVSVGSGLFFSVFLLLLTGNRQLSVLPDRRLVRITSTILFGVPVRIVELGYDQITGVFLKKEPDFIVVCLRAAGETFRLRSCHRGQDLTDERDEANAEAHRIAAILETGVE